MGIQVHQYTTPVIVLNSESTIYDAIFLMQKNDVKRIVIVKDYHPIGIVTERDIGKFLESDKTKRTMNEIYLDEIMSRNLITVNSEQPDIAMQSAIRMNAFQISSVIITNGEGKLIGITTKSDLVRNYILLYSGIYKVKDYMSRRIFTCRKSDSLTFALDMLNKNKISRLVVTDNVGKPVGIVTYDTFLRNSNYFKTTSKDRNYLLPTNLEKTTVGDVVESDLITVNSETDLSRAAQLISTYKVSGIPVIDENGDLQGIISSTDIVRAYSEVDTHSRLIKNDPHFD